MKHILSECCSPAHCHICWLPAWFSAWLLATLKKKRKLGRKRTRRLENVSRWKTKCFGWWSVKWGWGGITLLMGELATRGKLHLIWTLKKVSGAVPHWAQPAGLSLSNFFFLLLLLLLLAADKRTESDPDRWNYIGIWVTHYCHPNMCHPPMLTVRAWQQCTLCESNSGKTGGFPECALWLDQSLPLALLKAKLTSHFRGPPVLECVAKA